MSTSIGGFTLVADLEMFENNDYTWKMRFLKNGEEIPSKLQCQVTRDENDKIILTWKSENILLENIEEQNLTNGIEYLQYLSFLFFGKKRDRT